MYLAGRVAGLGTDLLVVLDWQRSKVTSVISVECSTSLQVEDVVTTSRSSRKQYAGFHASHNGPGRGAIRSTDQCAAQGLTRPLRRASEGPGDHGARLQVCSLSRPEIEVQRLGKWRWGAGVHGRTDPMLSDETAV